MVRPKPFHYILGLLALFCVVRGGIAFVDAQCTTRAWVRAPDLAPNTIIQGDVRVKISAGCPVVETVSLGLRLKERSFIKALRSQDRTWMKSAHPFRMDPLEASPWAYPPSRFDNRSKDIAAAELLANKDSWIVREEERIVFETMQPIRMTEGASGDHDVVQDFAVLVPSTNFPPAQDYLNSGFAMGRWGDVEIVDVESMNEYFIRVSFANGTTEDILAGFTGFKPLWAPVHTSLPKTMRLEPVGFARQDAPATNYTAEISADSSLVFTEASEQQFVTVVVTRTGPARRFSAPLTVWSCVEPVFSSKWAVEHDMTSSKPWHNPEYVLRSTLKDVEEAKHNSRNPPCLASARISVTMPNSTLDEIRSRDVVTTTSEPATIPVKVNRRHITNFDAYYQTIANSLLIMLETPRVDGETVDPDDPFSKLNDPFPWVPVFEDDEEEWVPWVKKKMPEMPQPRVWRWYRGPVPITVRPIGEATAPQDCVRASTAPSNQLILSDETCSVQPSLIHYLDDGARGPIFVDRSAIRELLAEDPVERELRAPILEPVVSTPPEGEELIFRYYHGRLVGTNPHKLLIYVGETWARKVVDRRAIET